MTVDNTNENRATDSNVRAVNEGAVYVDVHYNGGSTIWYRFGHALEELGRVWLTSVLRGWRLVVQVKVFPLLSCDEFIEIEQ